MAGQKDRAAHSLGSMAQALRETGQQRCEQDQADVTPYTDRIASEVERFSGYIERHNLGEMVGDVKRFARRQRALFLGGVFILGLMGARFLKSIAPQGCQQSHYPLARRDDMANPNGREPGYFSPAPTSAGPR